MHDGYPTSPQNFSEHSREICLLPFEMIKIAEVAKSSLDLALEHSAFVISDSSSYLDIPHNNGLRTIDARLAFADTSFSQLDITVPRIDTDTRIKIEGKDSALPNRRIQLEETTGILPNEFNGSFFVNDSHALTASRNGRSVAPMMSKNEVADWLFHQAGLSETESNRKIKTESDPVRHACDLLSIRATRQFDVRQVRVQFNPEFEMYGQLVEEIDTNNPMNEPLTRTYSVWVNQYHKIDGYPVTERVCVEFSPDDIFLGFDSPYASSTVSIESEHPTLAAEVIAAQQALEYENTGVTDVFARVEARMALFNQAA